MPWETWSWGPEGDLSPEQPCWPLAPSAWSGLPQAEFRSPEKKRRRWGEILHCVTSWEFPFINLCSEGAFEQHLVQWVMFTHDLSCQTFTHPEFCGQFGSSVFGHYVLQSAFYCHFRKCGNTWFMRASLPKCLSPAYLVTTSNAQGGQFGLNLLWEAPSLIYTLDRAFRDIEILLTASSENTWKTRKTKHRTHDPLRRQQLGVCENGPQAHPCFSFSPTLSEQKNQTEFQWLGNCSIVNN